MKFLFDLFPVIVFFAAFQLWGIYVATALAIAATVSQVAWLALRQRKIEKMLWASLAIIVVFGGLTLLLHDKTFIQWKPTVLYWLFSAVLAGGALTGRNLIQAAMSEQMQLPDRIWRRLNWSWVAFFAFMGAANLFVAYRFSERAWVNYKLFGAMGLLLAFVLAQAALLSRHVEDKT